MVGPTGTWKPVIRREIAWALVDGDVVLTDDARAIRVLTSTGALLWQLLDGSATIDEMSEDVSEVFGVRLDVARRDVIDFISSMLGANLLDQYVPTDPDDS